MGTHHLYGQVPESDVASLVTDLAGKQPLDADLTAIAGLSPTNDDILQRKSGSWINRTLAQLKTDLALAASDIVSGTLAIARIPTGTSSSTVAIGDDTRLSVKPYPPVDLTDGTTIATNAALGNHFRCAVGGNRTLGAPTNPTDGQVCTWELLGSGGARTLTLNAVFTYGSDITAISTIASGKTDFLQAVYRASATSWRIIGYVKGY